MAFNRELSFDDYVAIARRRLKVILIPALVAVIPGFLLSFAFSPRYTSNALILVERQMVSAGYVKPIVTASLAERIADLEQQVLSRKRLQPLVERLGLVKKGTTVDEVIDEIQNSVSITNPSATGMRIGEAPGFYLSYTTDNPGEAQQICSEITSMFLAENYKAREQVASSTTDFLSRQLSEAKSNLDDQDKRLAEFRSRYLGQLPSDVDNNLQILTSLNSQLESSTQRLDRAQEDKVYQESMLAQQLAAWKSSQEVVTARTIAQQLVGLRGQLVTLQARYTDDHPEVIRMKTDIAVLEAKRKELDTLAAKNPDADTDVVEGEAEPAAIRAVAPSDPAE